MLARIWIPRRHARTPKTAGALATTVVQTTKACGVMTVSLMVAMSNDHLPAVVQKVDKELGDKRVWKISTPALEMGR